VLTNTIVANNTVLGGGTGSDLRSNSVNDDFQLGFTLVETVPEAGSFSETVPGSNQYSVDPALGALQANGGPTPTHLPGPTSPVIDKGSTVEATDQRGRARPADFHSRSNPDDGADLGAVEVQIGPPTFTGTTPVSPSSDDTPRVRGSVPSAPEIDSANPVVQLYTSADCIGGAVGPASAPGAFGDPGITVGPLAHNATTTFYGRLTTGYGTSLCSPTSISYTQTDPAEPPPPSAPQSGITLPTETGERAAALRKCKAKKRRLQRNDRPWKKKYKKCRRRALALPV
jgi:hypothetical protein